MNKSTDFEYFRAGNRISWLILGILLPFIILGSILLVLLLILR